jgi:ribonuclease BN (tRNA processing enzyme)
MVYCMSMKVTLLGTGTGIPQPGRSQAAILAEAQKPLLVDCGAGTLLRLEQAGINVADLDAVVLTHLHLDHVLDLLAIANARYLQQLPGLDVYGPKGTDVWLKTIHSAFPNLEKMVISVHEVHPMDDFSVQGFDIFAEEARHSVTALAYRIDAEDKVLVYSGDTEPSSRIVALAQGADLLIHECSFPEPFDVTNHTTPKRLGRILKDVPKVALTHFYPQARGLEEEMAREVGELCRAEVVAGWDMMTMIV